MPGPLLILTSLLLSRQWASLLPRFLQAPPTGTMDLKTGFLVRALDAQLQAGLTSAYRTPRLHLCPIALDSSLAQTTRLHLRPTALDFSLVETTRLHLHPTAPDSSLVTFDLPRQQGWPAHKRQSFHSGSSSWRTQKLNFKVLWVSQALATWLSHKCKPLPLHLIQTLPLQGNRNLWTLNSRSGVCCAVWRNGVERGIPLCSLWAFHLHSTPPQP